MSKESNTLSLDIFHTWVSYYDYYRGYFFFLYCRTINQRNHHPFFNATTTTQKQYSNSRAIHIVLHVCNI